MSWPQFFCQPVKRESSTSTKANLFFMDFRWSFTFSSLIPTVVCPTDAEIMYHGTDARLPDGSGANSR